MEKQLNKGGKGEISFSGENTGLHWPEQLKKLLLHVLPGVRAALAMACFSWTDTPNTSSYYRVSASEWGIKEG